MIAPEAITANGEAIAHQPVSNQFRTHFVKKK